MIFTANYTFLNYLVLTLGFLLLDDRFFHGWVRREAEEVEAGTEAVSGSAPDG